MCGNHFGESTWKAVKTGSPPRVREPPRAAAWSTLTTRITPACAGTTSQTCPSFSLIKDHPRVCGNHNRAQRLHLKDSGSPPRVREPLDELIDEIVQAGITPACAGTTF